MTQVHAVNSSLPLLHRMHVVVQVHPSCALHTHTNDIYDEASLRAHHDCVETVCDGTRDIGEQRALRLAAGHGQALHAFQC